LLVAFNYWVKEVDGKPPNKFVNWEDIPGYYEARSLHNLIEEELKKL
ncbi:MAG: hypothetical protein CEO40_49, partial [Parcubacteria group bacterium LiPW_72]